MYLVDFSTIHCSFPIHSILNYSNFFFLNSHFSFSFDTSCLFFVWIIFPLFTRNIFLAPSSNSFQLSIPFLLTFIISFVCLLLFLCLLPRTVIFLFPLSFFSNFLFSWSLFWFVLIIFIWLYLACHVHNFNLPTL